MVNRARPLITGRLPLAYSFFASSIIFSSSSAFLSCFSLSHPCSRSSVTGVRVVSACRFLSMASSRRSSSFCTSAASDFST